MTIGKKKKSKPPYQQIKQLIWLYFFLLIFEGALRKWFLPSLSTPLLIIRDPVVLLIYALAYRQGIFPRNTFLLFGGLLCLASLTFGLLGELSSLPIALYGIRTNFLQLPLIFIIGKVWNFEDIKSLGRVVLLLSLPMAILMALQFRASSSSFLNLGAGGEENTQIVSYGQHVRASATFSFISGPIFFAGLVTAYLFVSQASKIRYPTWLTVSALLGLLLSIPMSGSRSVVVAVGIVVLSALLSSTLINPFLMFRWLGVGAVMGGLLLTFQSFNSTGIAEEGMSVLTNRFSEAQKFEGSSGGMLGRALRDFDIRGSLTSSPVWGYGLGAGTNVGAAIISGKRQFLLAEAEWDRVVMESGPIFGLLFILWRVLFVGWLGWASTRHAIQGNSLPLLFFGACGSPMLNGQWGQPTILGFSIMISGLCLASMRTPAKRRLIRPVSPANVRSHSVTTIPTEPPPLQPTAVA